MGIVLQPGYKQEVRLAYIWTKVDPFDLAVSPIKGVII